MTRAIQEYEFQNALEQSQRLIDEEIERFKNLDKLLIKTDFNSLANAVFGNITMVYLCRYITKIFEVMTLEEPNPDILFRSKKIQELCKKFNDRYLKALELYNKHTPLEIGQELSSEKLSAIYLEASQRFGSKKFDMDLEN